MSENKWKIKGFDPVEEKFYPINGEYDDREQAEKAAQKCLQQLELDQPSSNSGGQGEKGVQDRIFIVSAEGKEERVLPKQETWRYSMKEARSLRELEDAMEGSEKEVRKRSIRIILKMLEFIVRNVKISNIDMKKIVNAIKGERYDELMKLSEKIYQEQYWGISKFSQKRPTLLKKILFGTYSDEDYPLCHCESIGRISEAYIAGGAKEGALKFYCHKCETNF